MLLYVRRLSPSSWSLGNMQMRWIHITPSMRKKVPSNLKGKSKSSQEWITRQLNDPYVKKAQEMNFRARSAFKLLEIDDKAKILKPGQVVVECGAAPGAWSQIIVKRINADGKLPNKRMGVVIGIDLLPIAPLSGAIFLSGHDFTSKSTMDKIKEILMERKAMQLKLRGVKIETNYETENNEAKDKDKSSGSIDNDHGKDDVSPKKMTDKLVDVVLSDMAPNATGNRDTDHPRIVRLVETALAFAVENGKPRGHFLAKLWDGGEAKRVESMIASHYDYVSRYKPPSSRNDSSEFFVLGKYKK